MIMYLLKSAVCLLATLVFYKLVLEQQKMHRFNRFYLLASLCFAFLAPLLTIELEPDALPLPEAATPLSPFPESVDVALSVNLAEQRPIDTLLSACWLFYGLIACLLLVRFGRNLFWLFNKVRQNPTLPLGEATLVLLPERTLPHTFLNYLFVNGEAYQSGVIEPHLFTHELAHIRQQHSLDVLLVELLRCFVWFNPLLLGFKRAIQLNHEFLADEAVLEHHTDVPYYQQLLLSKITIQQPISLISTLTFQATKQRFAMMTKHTSGFNALLSAFGAAIIVGGLFLALSVRTLAQTKPSPAPIVQAKPTAAGKRDQNLSIAEMERRFGDKMVHLPVSKPGQRYKKKFSDLTEEQKKLVRYMPPFGRNKPTEAQLADWKNAKKFGVWVDDNRIQNNQLDRYKAQDFDHFFVSKLEKNAINYGKHYFQIDLLTQQGYQAYLRRSEESPSLFLVLPR